MCADIRDSIVPMPSSDVGSRKQIGQTSVIAPIAVANPLARFTPRGQTPNVRCQTINPISKASSRLNVPVKRNSDSRMDGRAMEGRMLMNTPSSHAKNRPAMRSVALNELQKDDENRKRGRCFFFFCFLTGDRFPARLIMVMIVTAVRSYQQQKTPPLLKAFFRNVVEYVLMRDLP